MSKTVLDKAPLIHLWRPLYRGFVTPVVWPLLRTIQRAITTADPEQPLPPPAAGAAFGSHQ